MEKLPASGEDGLVDEFRGLGREEWEESNEYGNEKASEEEMGEELTWVCLHLWGWTWRPHLCNYSWRAGIVVWFCH